jgi:SAM-dependent methyltransferase
MNDWSSGYVSDIGYTYGYYTELNPTRARLALLANGIFCPQFATACELGFGQGISANIHASATTCKWYGSDFNPSQASFANELARVSGNGATLTDEAFIEFCNRDDLPDFDFIGIHGIWSWISPENREILVDFIRRKLRVGGLLYISYNTMPGWASFAPLRKLMTQHSEVIGSEGTGILNRVEEALKFADDLIKTNPSYLSANPQLSERMEQLNGQDRHYLAHEYFNRDWQPMFFSDMANALGSAKLDYACSAKFGNFLDVVNLSKEQLEFLKTIPDATMRESVRDFMVNSHFRQDYWVKGKRSIPLFDQVELISQEKVILSVVREKVSMKFDCILGEANLNETIYSTILSILNDHNAHSIGEIVDLTKGQGIQLNQVLECLITLADKGQVNSVIGQDVEDSCVNSCHSLNAYFLNLSRSNALQSHLASPVTGGGIHVDRIHQLFLLAYTQGAKSPEGMANFSWQVLRSQNHNVLIDGKPLESDEENIGHLTKLAAQFLKERLNILRKLKILPNL